MRRALTTAAAAAFVTMLAVPGLALPALAADTDAKAAIEDQNAAFEKAFNSGDADKVASFYAEDAALFPPDSARVDGRDAIGEFWSGAIEGGLSDLDLKAVEVHQTGDMAVEVGTLTLSAPAAQGEGRSDLAGKYLVLWQRGQDGTWQLYRDIWNMGQ